MAIDAEDGTLSDHQQAAIARAVGAVTWQADPSTLRVTGVAGATEGFGHPRERWLGETPVWDDLVHPDDRGRFRRAVADALGEPRASGLQVRAVSPGGAAQRALAMVRAAPDGLLQGLLLATGLAVAGLGPEALTAVVEATPDVVALVDPDGRLRYVNPAGLELLEVDDPAGLSAADLYPPEALGALVADALPALARDGVWCGDTALVARSGRVVEVSAVVVAHGDPARPAWYSATYRDVAERTARERVLRSLAERDPLTGVLNRHVFASHLDQAVAAAARGRHSALLYLDLDRFKAVNDAHGHPAGDRVLVGVTAEVQAAIRAVDVLARMGGDEFVVLLHDVDVDQAVVVADGIRRAVADRRTDVGGSEVAVEVSIGVAAVEGTTTADEVLATADRACYVAKATGRNRVEAAASDA